MEKQLQELLENEVLGPEARQALQEAFANKLKEAETKLQESYAQRFEHERATLVEAMDKMLNDVVRKELEEFAQDKRAVAGKKVELTKAVHEAKSMYNRKLAQHVKMMEQFMQSEIRKEIQEFQTDRQQLAVQRESMAKELLESQQQTQAALSAKIAKLENFVLKQLSEEISEFQADKKALVEQRIKLASKAKRKLDETQRSFVNRATTVVDKTLNEVIKRELVQWRDDIQVARENNFGRRFFEAFASEFAITHLNENKEIAKLQKMIEQKDQQILEAKTVAVKQSQIVESKEKELKIIKESQERQQTLDELLKPLNKEKQSVMIQLLENVQTPRLRSAYEKYLPAVLNTGNVKAGAKTALTEESVITEATGDKAAKKEVKEDFEGRDNVIDIKRLAGL